MSVKLDGLTVVLLEGYPLLGGHPREFELVMETFLASKELGSDVRLFSVTNKLVELQHVPETFAGFGSVTGSPVMASAVNRVNILRPRRIVCVVSAPIESLIGQPRAGTTGYVWSTVAGPEHLEHWRMLHCDPLQIPITIRASEQVPDADQKQAH